MAMMHNIDSNMKRKLYQQMEIDEADVYGDDMKTILEEGAYYLIEKHEAQVKLIEEKASLYDELLKRNKELEQKSLGVSEETDVKCQNLKEANGKLRVYNQQLIQKLGVLENSKKLDFNANLKILRVKINKLLNDVEISS